MHTILFISGKNWKLSLAELTAYLKARQVKFEVEFFSKEFFTFTFENDFNASTMPDLGGTIKVGENADHSVMLSQKVHEPSEDETINKDMTGNLTPSDSKSDSKTKDQCILSELDCNDRKDRKNCNLKSSPISYDKLSEEELWNKSCHKDVKANKILQTILKKNSLAENRVSK